jgi:hypothetical protein
MELFLSTDPGPTKTEAATQGCCGQPNYRHIPLRPVKCSKSRNPECVQWPELRRVAVLSHSGDSVDWPAAQTLTIGSVDVCAMRAQAGQA